MFLFFSFFFNTQIFAATGYKLKKKIISIIKKENKFNKLFKNSVNKTKVTCADLLKFVCD